MTADTADGAGKPPAIVEVPLTDRPYRIVVGDGVLRGLVDLDGPVRLGDHLGVPAGAARALLVTQEPVVAAGHVDPVASALADAGIEVVHEVVPDGEAAKRVEVLEQLWHRAAEVPLSRQDLVVAVGGGVVGDLAGFVAATYNRGIAVLQVPTTLLAQVDAAIGGKTGINLPAGKNLVGAFHQPCAVLCDTSVLRTLSPRLLTEGFGEVVKYGLIADPVVLELLELTVREGEGDGEGEGDPRAVGVGQVGRAAGAADGAGAAGRGRPGPAWSSGLLTELVERSVAVKAAVVAADEREGGARAYLNLGHTYGHAVEALTGYAEVLHGEAVAIGTVVALRLGVALGRTDPELALRGEALLAAVGLPVRGPRLDRAEVWRVMGRDKKAAGGQVRFVVLDDVGAPTVVTPEPATVDGVLDELEVG